MRLYTSWPNTARINSAYDKMTSSLMLKRRGIDGKWVSSLITAHALAHNRPFSAINGTKWKRCSSKRLKISFQNSSNRVYNINRLTTKRADVQYIRAEIIQSVSDPYIAFLWLAQQHSDAFDFQEIFLATMLIAKTTLLNVFKCF